MASQLLSEIVSMNYAEPDDTPTFGRESGESGSERSNWDDVDDYEGWLSTPPENAAGVALSNGEGWQREVQVEWVDPANLASISVSDQGLKRITVTVYLDGQVIARKAGLRSDH